ncbi:hypothetical protein F0223_23820 [Vibrio coralliilyticus]|uniref:hypothetical protein n=1 Tax=Vibrio TaxID=662 RepID=UPI0005043D62|nr:MULTISPECIES: hypothetical protein [Vibrio]KFI12080.1 hypothetical protein IX95_10600 [Vibrio sp. B183]NOI21229.1 hypothetical protein [Vibrio coralliilyticus]
MKTVAEEILKIFGANKELEALECAMAVAITVREANDYSVYRFVDLSSVRVYISNEHEITILEE